MLPSASLIATRNRTATSDAINTVRNRSASGALFNVLIEHHEDVAAPSPRSTSPFIAPALLDAELRRDLESGRESVDSTISRPDSPAFLPSSSSSTNSSIGSVTSVSAIGSAATSPTPLIKSPRSRSPRASALLIGSRRSNTGVESLDVSPSTAALVAEASAAARALRMIDSRKPLSKSMGDLGQDVQELHFALHSLALQACPLTKDHALESIASLQGGEEAPTAPTPPPRGPVRAMTTAHGESLGYEWDRGSGSGGDTWRENLRKQWQEESLLSASTRKLEHSVSSSSLSTAIAAGATSPVTAPPSTSASSSNLSLSSSSSMISASGSLISGSDVASRRQTRKRLDMLRDQLEQRRVAMRALCVKAEAKVKELREREAQSRAQIKEHVDRYTAWHAIQLRQVYRSSAILQLVHLSLNRVIMERKAALLAQRAEELQRAVTAIRAGDNKPVPAELSEDTNALFNKPDINRAVTRIHRLGDAVVRLQPELVRLRNAANTEGITRVNRAKQLLEATPLVEGLPYHELNAQRQRAFDAILLDERYKEGKSILRMRRALIERAAEVTPADVVEFLEAFMAQVTTDWAVPAALGPRLRVYIQRAVFPLIWTDCAELLAQDSAASVADALLASRMAAIRSLSPTQMHLDPLYFAEGDPFSEATNTLNSLPYEVVPIDLLYILRKTMQQTLDALKRLQSVVKGIAADDILPAFIWVVARSDVACPNMHAVLMDAFSANADKMGEFGYCLTSYHAAVMHLGSLAQ